MRRRGIVLTLVAVGTLAGCSSGGDASPAPTTSAPTIVATTDPAPPTTAAPTTTDAPTTTVDPAVALAAEVEADYRETLGLTNDAFQEPTDDAAGLAAIDGYVGDAQTFVMERLDEFRSNNWAATPNPSVQADLLAEKPAQRVAAETDLVEMQVCEVDPWIVVERGAGPNGSDVIVDAEMIHIPARPVLTPSR